MAHIWQLYTQYTKKGWIDDYTRPMFQVLLNPIMRQIYDKSIHDSMRVQYLDPENPVHQIYLQHLTDLEREPTDVVKQRIDRIIQAGKRRLHELNQPAPLADPRTFTADPYPIHLDVVGIFDPNNTEYLKVTRDNPQRRTEDMVSFVREVQVYGNHTLKNYSGIIHGIQQIIDYEKKHIYYVATVNIRYPRMMNQQTIPTNNLRVYAEKYSQRTHLKTS